MTDALLIQPPVSFKNKAWTKDIIPDCPNLGLLYLAAGIQQMGLTVMILDAIDGKYTLQDIVNTVKSERPKVIGITAMTMNIRGAVQLAGFLKENTCSDIKIALGGPHISADPTIINRYPYFDFGVTGEGDITFPRLVKIISDGSGNVSGLYSGEVPLDLDKIPPPARQLVDFDEYKRRNFWANAIFATRGCPYHCTFCSIPAMSKQVRYRTTHNIIEEMEEAYRLTGISYFVFIDDALTIKKSFVYELCEEIKNLSFKPKWVAQSRINYVDDNLLNTMKRAGCYKLLFGVESGSERIRNDIIKKKITDKQIEFATRLCWKNGIEPDHYLMLGFPTETMEEISQTINCPLKFRPSTIGVHLTMPLPGSPLFEDAIKDGIIEEDVIDKYIEGEYGETYKGAWPYYIPKGIKYEELIHAREEAYRKFYLRPGYVMLRLWRDAISYTRLKADIRQGFSLIFNGTSTDDTTR